jgi:two-component system nitrogen regulation sensor histidine kinase GlnL
VRVPDDRPRRARRRAVAEKAGPPRDAILVLSADRAAIDAVRRAFRRRAARVVRAPDAAAALSLARSGPAVIVLDLDRPRLPVRALLDRLAAAAPGAVAILAAGPRRIARAVALARETGLEVVPKPLAGPRLRRAAHVAAKRREVEEESRAFVERLAESNRLLSETQSHLRGKILAINEELLHLQELNASIFRNMGWGLLLTDPDGSVTRLNPAAEQILGVTEAAAVGRAARDVLRVRESAPLDEALGHRAAPYEVEVIAQADDGRDVPLLLRATALRSAQGAVSGLLVLFNDLSRLKAQDRELRRVERLASLGALSAGMAHEIRNPLAGIETTAELLGKRMPQGDPGRDLVGMIVDEVRRLNRLIEDLLRFARPSAPQFASLPIGGILDRCLTLLARAPRSAGLTIVRHYAPGLPPVDVDPGQITQVFLNVIKNAIEASPASGTVTLRAELAEDTAQRGLGGRAGHVVRVRIADEGAGIAPDLLEKIWDPFFTTKPAGTGLGLPICQRIVAEHRGRIRIASEPGRGAEVVVDLPVPLYGAPDVAPSEAIDHLSTIYG